MTEREAQLEAMVRRLEEELRKGDEKIRRLEETVAALLKRIYGTKSEKIDPAQLELLLAGDEPEKAGSSDGADAPEEDDAANANPHFSPKEAPKSCGLGITCC